MPPERKQYPGSNVPRSIRYQERAEFLRRQIFALRDFGRACLMDATKAHSEREKRIATMFVSMCKAILKGEDVAADQVLTPRRAARKLLPPSMQTEFFAHDYTELRRPQQPAAAGPRAKGKDPNGV